MRNVIEYLQTNSRFWLIFSNLAMRGAGFITTLLLSRMYGTVALGTYSVTVNTAVALTTPFTLVFANNATVLGADGTRKDDGGRYYTALFIATLAAAFLGTVISIIVFVIYFCILQSDMPPSVLLPLIAGIFVIVGEMLGVVSQGFLYGAGQFFYPARVTFFVALVVCVAAFPVVKIGGLGGALLLLIILSILPPLLMTIAVLSGKGKLSNSIKIIPNVWKTIRQGLLLGTPTFLTAIMNNASYWICTVYLVQTSYGAAGVGIVAVAGQWLNLMLIPATSWSSLSLKILADFILNSDRHNAWIASKALVRKNLLATLALAASIAVTADIISKLYNLNGTDLSLIILINAVYAIIKSVNIVLDRFLFVLGLQHWSAFFSLLSCGVQIMITYLLLPIGLWVVALGTLSAGVFLCILSYIGILFLSHRPALVR